MSRAPKDPAVVVASLHEAIRELDTSLPLFDVRTIADHLQIAVFLQRMVASRLGAFGLLALVLATVGLYGVVAALVAQRTPEIGMRMALGARTTDIIALVFGQGFAMIGVGIAVGILVALGVTRFFNSLLVGVRGPAVCAPPRMKSRTLQKLTSRRAACVISASPGK